MTEVCEVWSDGELAALVLGTTAIASAAFLGIILLCVWLAGRAERPDTDARRDPAA
ncbi:hypothetical protein LV457_03020 [Mycobacterium sp. MYCO198283]|uniref:hypothetical protein n=1 Tax=Mycobacterium sp. MYCO198283 TaxID=2883505 RepID=UPI001E4340FC|nr:hypothetical protein [Mycobacterium sp. MYCO198283]MCG5431261.1 hypothetical protein [Mycobacterium sp. MYCO198283]